MLKNIQVQLNYQEEKLNNLEKNVTESINSNINEKFVGVEAKYHKLTETVQQQEKRIDYLEKYIRRRNIVVFGVDETERNNHELVDMLSRIFKDNMSVTITTSEIESLYRLGQNSDKTRPILMSLTTANKKYELLTNRSKLAKNKLSLSENYPLKVQQQRKALKDSVKQLRQEGKNAYIGYNKLIVKDEDPLVKPSNKRNFPEVSPSSTQNKQITKRNKPGIASYLNITEKKNKDIPPSNNKL